MEKKSFSILYIFKLLMFWVLEYSGNFSVYNSTGLLKEPLSSGLGPQNRAMLQEKAVLLFRLLRIVIHGQCYVDSCPSLLST